MLARCEVMRSKVKPHGISHIIVSVHGRDLGVVRQYKRPMSDPPVYVVAWDGARSIPQIDLDRIWADCVPLCGNKGTYEVYVEVTA
jgi:hypothetical protein